MIKIQALYGELFYFCLLQSEIRYTLGSAERLKSRKAIELLFASGKSFSLFPFRITWQLQPAVPGAACCLQAAFSVSKRYFKKATHRNRIKRLMKETYRLQKPALIQQLQQKNQQMQVFLVYTGNDLPEHLLLKEKTGAVIRRLQKILHEETASHT